MKAVVGLAVAALVSVGLVAPAQALEGDGFSEQILTCAGNTIATVHVPEGSLFMVRWAPECEPRDPITFKVTKPRKVKVHSHKDGRAYFHSIWVLPR